ncbi:MAG: AAA family ATPase [Muribaculaceae bacterium]|nr:AAA family ATPase [Muribaculaceae bacterium]
MRPVFLTGFMGTGKSTLGRALAARVDGLRFVDLDDAAEARLGCTASEAFAAGRSDAFRQAEAEALAQLCEAENVVVACGGGTPCYGDNMERMLAAGTVVLLTAERGRLLRRLTEAPGKRPLVDGLEGKALSDRVDELMRAREDAYSRAHAVFDATRLETVAEVEATAEAFIAEFLSNSINC